LIEVLVPPTLRSLALFALILSVPAPSAFAQSGPGPGASTVGAASDGAPTEARQNSEPDAPRDTEPTNATRPEPIASDTSASSTVASANRAISGPSASTSSAQKRGRFVFGSYGRVRAASDLRGKTGKSSNIEGFGSRNDLDNYAELELRREDNIDELELRVVATLALTGDFFHYDGDFQENLAVRNLYADVANTFTHGLSFWAGSRMVRGDDIYLLNFWPLDNLNLIGGGTRYNTRMFEFALHGGLTRPNNPFYKQTIDVPPALGFTPAKYDLLDRPRSVIAFKGTYFPFGKVASGLKATVYGEGHRLPSGQRKNENDALEQLPSDSGFVLGAQLGGWLDKPKSFTNLFVRYASGIAVYDPLATPMQVGTVTSASSAREFRVGIASNLETHAFGVQFGGYLRSLRDEANSALSGGKLLEGAVDVRPYVWFLDYAGLSVDAGYQALALSTIDDRTGKQVKGSVTKLAVIPFISPYGRGTYTRPHIHLIYQLSLRDSGARHLYPEQDRRSHESTEHFFAVGAEWWFDSTSY
jgi:maltoporin